MRKYRSTFLEEGRPMGYKDFQHYDDAKIDFEASKTHKEIYHASIIEIEPDGSRRVLLNWIR
jgi:hypothetical protein